MKLIIENKITRKEAVLYTGENKEECCKFMGLVTHTQKVNFPTIKTLEGLMRIDKGDYIIKGIKGEFYPCKPDIFKESYSIVEMTESFLD